jgi:hypothetical protein
MMTQFLLCTGAWLLEFLKVCAEEVSHICTEGDRGSGGHKQQRPSLRMTVCTTHDPNVYSSVCTGGLPASLIGLTARFTRSGFIDRQGTSRKRLALDTVNGGFGGVAVRHFHEAEAPDWPVSRSVMIRIVSTSPYDSKSWRRS